MKRHLEDGENAVEVPRKRIKRKPGWVAVEPFVAAQLAVFGFNPSIQKLIVDLAGLAGGLRNGPVYWDVNQSLDLERHSGVLPGVPKLSLDRRSADVHLTNLDHIIRVDGPDILRGVVFSQATFLRGRHRITCEFLTHKSAGHGYWHSSVTVHPVFCR